MIGVLILLIALVGCTDNNQEYGKTSTIKASVSENDNLAQCLTEKGATMYGTEWCSHCKNQKAAFGNSVELINYVDCDVQASECRKAGVRGYPTWKIGGENYPGEQPLGRLASLAGCELS